MKTGIKRIAQSVFSFFFIIMVIGSGHLLMITIEHFDMKFSAREYAQPGLKAVWHGDSTQQAELRRMIDKCAAKGKEEEAAFGTLTNKKKEKIKWPKNTFTGSFLVYYS